MKLHNIEQNTPEWDALRCGKATASEFGSVVTSKGEPSKSAEPYAYDLAAELYAEHSVDAWNGNKWTDRGKIFEADAVKYYQFINGVDVEKIGFVSDGEIGCSPDGLVGKDGLLETKCLMAKHHIKALLRYRKDNSIDPAYIQQTQGQIMICQRGWCDLLFYHPDLPSFVARQGPIRAVVDGLKAQLPKLIARRDEVLSELRKEAA